MYGGNAIFTVGELLRLFCTTLQEQIKHRMYFYKMATLVREGMIIVHNSGLNGDPTSAKVRKRERRERGPEEKERGGGMERRRRRERVEEERDDILLLLGRD